MTLLENETLFKLVNIHSKQPYKIYKILKL